MSRQPSRPHHPWNRDFFSCLRRRVAICRLRHFTILPCNPGRSFVEGDQEARAVRSALVKVFAGLVAVIVLSVTSFMLTFTAAKLEVASVDVGGVPIAS